MITANDLRPGKAFELDGELYIVTSFQHIKPGKGSPFVRVKIRGIKSNVTTERTFRPDEKLKDAYLEHKKIHKNLLTEITTILNNLQSEKPSFTSAGRYIIQNIILKLMEYNTL